MEGVPGASEPPQASTAAVQVDAAGGWASPPVGTQFDPVVEPARDRVGIACSGGGIRSATFSLGALQVLRGIPWRDNAPDILGGADYLAGVSGGAYIAIAHHVLVSESLRTGDEEDLFGALPPYAPGSLEEEHLRHNSTYIAQGFEGKLWVAVNALFAVGAGVVTTLAIGFILAFGIANLFSRWLWESTTPVATTPASDVLALDVPLWLLLFAGIATFIAVAFLWVSHSLRMGRRARWLRVLRSGILATALAAGAGLLAILAAVALWIVRSLIVGSPDAKLVGPIAGLAALWAALAAITRSAKQTLPRWKGLLLAVGGLAAVLATIGFMVYAVMWIPWVKDHAAVMFWASVGIVGFVWLSRFLSRGRLPIPHVFYRECLSSAFIGRRQKNGDRIEYVSEGAGGADWQEPIRFSLLRRGEGSAKLPELIVGATVNTANGTPPGRRGVPICFERGFSGGPDIGYVRTSELEAATGVDALTLPGVMAMSGAAFAPAMGRQTIPGMRMLFSMANVTLGSWIDHPRRANGDRRRSIVEARADLLPSGTPVEETSQRRKFLGWKWLLREALGMGMTLEQKYLYITDGGHWDNLGLVELLRRGCMRIIVLDASGGEADGETHFAGLEQSVALARSELGVEITFDHTVEGKPVTLDAMKQVDGQPAERIAVRASIHYPDVVSPGVLIFAKAVVPLDAPVDVLEYRATDPRFPSHSTGDQFFDDRQFESYLALGRHAGRTIRDMWTEMAWSD